MIAPKSSIIARAIKKTFKETGTRFPNNDNTPIEKAISVADGIAHPLESIASFKVDDYINNCWYSHTSYSSNYW